MQVSWEVVWLDGQGSSQCKVPMLCFPFVKVPAFIGLVFAFFSMLVPCGFVGLLCFMLPPEVPMMPMLLVAGGFCFGVVFADYRLRIVEVTADSTWCKTNCDR